MKLKGDWIADGERVGPAHHFPEGSRESTCGRKHRPERAALGTRRPCSFCLRSGAPPMVGLAVPQAGGPLAWTAEAVRVLAAFDGPEGTGGNYDAWELRDHLERSEERAALLGLDEVTPDAVRAALGHPHALRDPKEAEPEAWV